MASKVIIPHRLGFKPKDIIITAAIPDYAQGANAHPSVTFESYQAAKKAGWVKK